MSASGRQWLLINCSPDVAEQIEAFPPLQPPPPRGTPIAGMLFTDANVDHLGGLAVLRQQGDHRFILRSSPVVREIAGTQPAFAPFARAPHRWLDVPLGTPCDASDADDAVGNVLSVRAIPVVGTTPGYDGRRSVRGAVVAYEIAERGGGERVLFAPVFGAIDDELGAAIESAHVALLDGTFYDDDELLAQGAIDKRARALGHLPVGGSDGTLARLRGVRTRVIFTHLNNTNPMLDAASEAFAAVREFGAEIAYDGLEFAGTQPCS